MSSTGANCTQGRYIFRYSISHRHPYSKTALPSFITCNTMEGADEHPPNYSDTQSKS